MSHGSRLHLCRNSNDTKSTEEKGKEMARDRERWGHGMPATVFLATICVVKTIFHLCLKPSYILTTVLLLFKLILHWLADIICFK